MNKRLRLAELVPGLVLAADLRREDGALLLPIGTVLNGRQLALLPAWGVTEVLVLGAPEPAPAAAAPEVAAPADAVTPEQWRQAAERIRPRFVHADLTHPGMAAIFAMCPPRAARRLVRKGPDGLGLPAPLPEGSLPPPPTTPAPGPMALIESDPKLTSLPDVFVRISEVLNDPHSTAREAAEAIGKDTGLSARLLRLVNSAFYGFPVKVDTLSRAVTIVGSRQLTTLALGLSVIGVFKDVPKGLVDMRSFWKHSLACGVVAANLPVAGAGAETERLFVAGLLHDVGRLVLYRCLPRHMARILVAARVEGSLLRLVERAQLGYDHAVLGGMLLRRWRFPESLTQAVRQHHVPPDSPDATLSATVHVADVLVGALGLGGSGEIYVPPLSSSAWTRLGLEPARIEAVTSVAEAQFADILRAFLPEDA